MIFVYMGVNDWGNEVDLGEWTQQAPPDVSAFTPTQKLTKFVNAYNLLVYELQTTYPNAEIYCFTLIENPSRGNNGTPPPSTNENLVKITDFNDMITDIATYRNSQEGHVHVIDLYQCGITWDNAETYLADGLHPNSAGMKVIADYVINQLL